MTLANLIRPTATIAEYERQLDETRDLTADLFDSQKRVLIAMAELRLAAARQRDGIEVTL